jgi:glutaredoxin
MSVSVTLIGRDGCHLCDDARAIVLGVLSRHDGIAFSELSIDDDEALANRYREEIPVVLINGEVHNFWRIDPERFDRALTERIQR